MRKATLCFLALAAALLLAVSCASIGNPSGGPRDEDPPRFVSATPELGATEVTPSKVVLTFDELITLKDAFNKVVVSPPPGQMPRVSSLGRRVTVDFRDTLLPETTYTLDFGDAIADNNEGNQMDGFLYTFSTGQTLDSLMVSGMVLGAQDLVPAAGIYVGLHSNLEDSAFRKTRFERLAKTNEDGKFVIGGLAPGRYRVYALDDRDGDLAWSSPDETLAFYDAVVEPFAERTVATDSIFNLLTGAVDTVVQRARTRFLPNNILLRSYNTGFAQQYITNYAREDSTRLSFTFNTKADSMPEISVILPGADAGIPIRDIAVVERSATNDTLAFWLTDPEVIAADTLRVAMRYFRADSVYNMVAVDDTLRMLTQRPPVKAKKAQDVKKKKEEADSLPPPVPTIELRLLNPKPEVNQSVTIEFPEPLVALDSAMVRLEVKEDTLWLPAKDFDIGRLRPDSLNPRRLRVEYPWEYETAYRLSVDSLAGKGIYGLFTDDLSQEFTIRAENEYSTLRLNLSNMGPDTVPRFVELLGSSGTPLQALPLEEGSVTFRYLLPNKYNVRVVEDLNGNGIWDPGNFDLGIQPDVAYYYNETIELKANWDQEIDWNVFATPVDRQLPESLQKKKTTRR